MGLWDPYAEFEQAQLRNGLSVYNLHRPRLPQFIDVVVHSGAQCDAEGYEGTAHFVEHLVSNNAPLESRELGDFFHDAGGKVNLGSTNFTYTTYGFFLPCETDMLEQGLSLFGTMLLDSKLDKFMERERGVILGEYNSRFRSEMQANLTRRNRQTVYENHWISRYLRPLGTKEAIGRIGQPQVQEYFNSHYVPANMSIVSVGGLSMEELLALLSNSPFAQVKSGTRTPLPEHNLACNPLRETLHVMNVSEYIQGVSSASYESTAKLPRGISQQALELFIDMLNVRLDDEVRQKRAWTYGINARPTYTHSFYEVNVICSSLEADAADNIEELVTDCISSVAEDGTLFEKLRRRKIAQKYMRDWTSGHIGSAAIDDITHEGRITTLAEDTAACELLTLDDVRGISYMLRPWKRYTLLLKP